MNYMRWRWFRQRRPLTGPAEVERILRDGICSECGSWRCGYCQALIVFERDHHPYCPRYARRGRIRDP